jgi:hypothetical protein
MAHKFPYNMQGGSPLGYHQDSKVFSLRHGEDSLKKSAAEDNPSLRKYGRVNLLRMDAGLRDEGKQL